MADACESVISHQSESILLQYQPAPKQLNVKGIHEIAIHDPSTSLIAAAGSIASQWVICVVKTNSPPNPNNIDHLMKAWIAAQYKKIDLPEYQSITINDGYTIGPARVLCKESGNLSVVFGFLPSKNEFRIGAMNRIPSTATNPCEMIG